jgi:adenylate cyclase
MEFRIGVNLGDVMVEGVQIYGDGVNVAARLESLADPGGICISGTVHEQVRDKLGLGYEDRGEQTVKNIARPVHVWRLLLNGTPAGAGTQRIPRDIWRGRVLSLAGLAIIIATIVLVQHLSLKLQPTKPQPTSASIPAREKPALALPSIPSIAVLPFTNVSGDPQQEYFNDGITDQLINDLSQLPGLFVIARNSSFAYKGKPTTESEIGKELGVKYLLEGSVRKAADQVRIGVELVDASTGREMWTQNYNEPLKNVFAVQDEIVNKVVTTLGLLFKLEEMRLPHSGPSYRTQNMEAFDDLLRAQEAMWRLTKDGNARARQWAQKVIELDPQYPAGYVVLGQIYWGSALFQWSENPQADLERSTKLAQEALTMDNSNVYALALLCSDDWMLRRFDRSVAEGERAVAINPNYAEGYVALAVALNLSNKPEEALRAVQKAMQLDPSRHDSYAFYAAIALVLMAQYQQAIPLLKSNLTVYPDNVWAHANLVVAYTELARDDDARAEAAEVMRISPRFSWGKTNKDESVNRRYNDDMRKAGLK